jgi:hypothetical protein
MNTYINRDATMVIEYTMQINEDIPFNQHETKKKTE